MSDPVVVSRPTRGYWITSWLALVWNLIGVAAYLMTVTMSHDALAAMPAGERALYESPNWVTSSYAIAVWGGTIASVGLLLTKAWSVPLFVLSLVAIVLQMTYWLFFTAALQVKGMSAAAMPLIVVVIGVYLVVYARAARRKGWIGDLAPGASR